MELAYRRMRAMFEFLDKLGVDYWCFHDRSASMACVSRDEGSQMLCPDACGPAQTHRTGAGKPGTGNPP